MDREEEELNAWRAHHNAELKRAGLKRIGIVLQDELNHSEFINKKGFMNVYDLEMKIFSTTLEAKQWIAAEYKKDNKINS